MRLALALYTTSLVGLALVLLHDWHWYRSRGLPFGYLPGVSDADNPRMERR